MSKRQRRLVLGRILRPVDRYRLLLIRERTRSIAVKRWRSHHLSTELQHDLHFRCGVALVLVRVPTFQEVGERPPFTENMVAFDGPLVDVTG